MIQDAQRYNRQSHKSTAPLKIVQDVQHVCSFWCAVDKCVHLFAIAIILLKTVCDWARERVLAFVTYYINSTISPMTLVNIMMTRRISQIPRK